ncbi:hypothetical protein NMD21_22045 [Citrobacter portucalensis]|uniref:hypothetical protein n=1 Tax=Citrobacter portucalensis TaxID=1639133 RepID=UPI00351CCD7B
MDVKTRNERAKQYILDQFKTVSKFNSADFEDLPDYIELKKITEDLIYVSARGFRGIVATALTGKYLDPNYDYLNNFYDCSPRSIFEQGIFYAFQEMEIPSGKSDPLNVAKNNNVLDENWTKGKRPQKAALAVITLLRKIYNEKNTEIQSKTINYFFYRLYTYSLECGSIVTKPINKESILNQSIASKLVRFSLQYPESGTVPQFVISCLLSAVYNSSTIKVVGGEDSVFGTNTTSKKPADVWLEENGNIYNLYEITVKKIDIKRLDDSIQALSDTDCLDKTVIFICRIPEDISTLEGYQNGILTYNNKSFNFIDISEFIRSTIALLPPETIKKVITKIEDFIGSFMRPTKTKEGWNTLFSVNTESVCQDEFKQT